MDLLVWFLWVAAYGAVVSALVVIALSPLILVWSLLAPGRRWWRWSSQQVFTTGDRRALLGPAVFLSLPGLLGGVPLLLAYGAGLVLIVGSWGVWVAAIRLRRGISGPEPAILADRYAKFMGAVWALVLGWFVVRLEVTVEGFLVWLALGPWFLVSVLCGRQLRLAAESLEREVASDEDAVAADVAGER